MASQIISSVLLIFSIALLFGFTPEKVTSDLMKALTPDDTLRDKASNIRGNRRRHRIYSYLMKIRMTLSSTGKAKQFTVCVTLSLVLAAAGIIISMIIDNMFLAPVLAVSFGAVPFLYVRNSISYYEKRTNGELETALSVITTSYERSDDLVSAVRENIRYIKPPLRDIFMSFEGEVTAVSGNIKSAIYSMRDKLDNDVFREWCDTLISCQDDRTLKDTLRPVVSRLADVRTVNSELSVMMAGVRNEYLVMAALVIGNIPLLYVLNKDWFATLMYTTPGKAVLGICGLVIMITAALLVKYTRPVEYRRKKEMK